MAVLTLLAVIGAVVFGGIPSRVCTKQRCDFLKAWLPFFIILHHHAMAFEYSSEMLNGDFRLMGVPVVMMFFFISGYGMEYKRERGEAGIGRLPSRLVKPFVPTLAPLLLYVAVLWLFGRDVMSAMSLNMRVCNYPLPYSWFVVTLAFIYLLFFVCVSVARLFRSERMFLALLALSLVAVMYKSCRYGVNSYIYESDMAFVVGVVYRQRERAVLSWLDRRGRRTAVASAWLIRAATEGARRLFRRSGRTGPGSR